MFLAKIERIGPGILLHDSSAEEIVRRNNRTLELTQHIMPTLLAQGYRFVRLDEVP